MHTYVSLGLLVCFFHVGTRAAATHLYDVRASPCSPCISLINLLAAVDGIFMADAGSQTKIAVAMTWVLGGWCMWPAHVLSARRGVVARLPGTKWTLNTITLNEYLNPN